MAQTGPSDALRTSSGHSNADLRRSLCQLLCKTGNANRAPSQQEVHFTRPIISMLRKFNFSHNIEVREISDVFFSLIAQTIRFAVETLLLSSFYISYLTNHFHIFSSIPVWLIHFMERLGKLF